MGLRSVALQGWGWGWQWDEDLLLSHAECLEGLGGF